MISSITSKVISVLGNPEATTPLFIKDTATSLSLTQFAKREGGSIESGDKFIDEFGTMAIWLGGIPFFKKIINNTLYKLVKLDAGIDVRVLQSKVHNDFAKEHATGALAKAIDFASNHKSLAKNMFYTKFAMATGLSIASYIGLTKLRHYVTKKKSEQKVYRELANKKFSRNLIAQSSKLKFSSQLNNNKNNNSNSNSKIAFGHGFKPVQAFMFNPALNTLLVDWGILGTRVATSRPGDDDKNRFLTPEQVEYLAKDGFIMFFYYGFAPLMQPKIDKWFEKLTGSPVGVDARALGDSGIIDAFKEGVAGDIELFKQAKDERGVLEFLHNNPNNVITRAAKISDIVRCTDKAKMQIDYGKYIRIDKVKALAENLEKLAGKIEKAGVENTEKILKTSRNYKIASILTGLGVCLFSVGYIMPKFLYDVVRKKYNNGSTTFHVQKHIEQEIKDELIKKNPNLAA